MENGHILAAGGSAIHTFLVFCTIYRISVPVTYIQEPLKFSVKVLVSTSDLPCRKISSWNVDGIIIVHILLGPLAVDLSIDCKY